MADVYMDHAATAPIDPEVLEAMRRCMEEHFGNPSSLHTPGRQASECVERSREAVARAIGATAEEVVFTSGGTEGNNLALKGTALRARAGRIVTTRIEHPSVLETCGFLKSVGLRVTYVPVDRHGLVDPRDVERAIDEDTLLVSVMHANNEIGTIQPIEEIGRIAGARGVPFHTDAVQSAGMIPIDVARMPVDLLTLSAHKIHGPKGVGALFVRKGTRIDPILHGGGHERGLRSSTENVAGIAGFAKACTLASAWRSERGPGLALLRDRLIEGVLAIEETRLNGHPDLRLANNAHFTIQGVEGEALVMMLDQAGIAASTGSACSSRRIAPSHVLLAIGSSPAEAHSSLRLTLGRRTSHSDVERLLEVLPGTVRQLRAISPTWGR